MNNFKIRQLISGILAILVLCAFLAWNFTYGAYLPKPLGENVIYVCKTGGDVDAKTITDGLNLITDASASNPYTIQICPSIYEENIVGKNYVSLVGFGGISQDVVIQANSGTVITAPDTKFTIENITVKSEPTSSGVIIYDASAGGQHHITRSYLLMQSSANGITGQLLKADATGVYFFRSDAHYLMSGNSVGVQTHNPIEINGSTSMLTNALDFRFSVADDDDNFTPIKYNTTGIIILSDAFVNTILSSSSYSGIVKTFEFTKAPSFSVIGQIFTYLNSAGNGTAYSIYLDSDTNNANITFSSNTFDVIGFTNNYFSYVGTGDTINSIADHIEATQGDAGTGIINHINSSAAGQATISDGVFAIDTDDEWHAFNYLLPDSSVTTDEITSISGLSGNITAVADAGGGDVTVTSAGHGLSQGCYITFTGSSNYDGIYRVNASSTDTFTITAVFAGTDTGTFRRGTGFIIENRGIYRIGWSFSMASSVANQNFSFASFKNNSEITGTKLDRSFSTALDVGIGGSSPLIFAERGDHIWFGVRNNTSAGDITLSEGVFNLTKEN